MVLQLEFSTTDGFPAWEAQAGRQQKEGARDQPAQSHLGTLN